ncbi:hypothetical protein QWY99_08400 [Flavobacterium branchiarum]|uniref:Uncharacterized protein n=1 Tax=Flavobacterium branchiarum TaxID=1114870 RepID=A0ABV5FMT3_9FLAO|nr:hypothetical protein [Flavobacterium branchiarum]MDN3673066.1 hypothetical protein [Flavobacterium branchiarum]
MIQLNTAYTHSNRFGGLTGKLQIEITSWTTMPDAKIFSIEDFVIDEYGAKHQINCRQKRVENNELDTLGVAVKSARNFEGMTDSQKDWAKAKAGLLLFIQSDLLDDGIHTIYGKLPGDWELTPQV